MMNRPIRCLIWGLSGLFLLACALLVPAHFRAVDIKLIEKAGANTPSVVQSAAKFLSLEQIGPARMLWQASQTLALPGSDQLGTVLTKATSNLAKKSPPPNRDSNALPVSTLFEASDGRPVMELLLEPGLRQSLASYLQNSQRPGVQEILRNRALTNTVQFPPAMSASGQPFDAVVILVALLSQTDRLPPPLREKFELLASATNTGGDVQALEASYLDMLSLGQRLDWQQLAALLRKTEDSVKLHNLAETLRSQEERLPIIYTAAILSHNPAQVVEYLKKFPRSGVEDLRTALSHGTGALRELLDRQQRIYAPKWRLALIGYDPFGAYFYAMLPFSRLTPFPAVLFRCLLLLGGAFCLARSIGMFIFDRTGQQAAAFDSTRFAQELTVALCLFFVLLVSIEPFIISDTPKTEPPVRTRVVKVGTAVASQIKKQTPPSMSLATLAPLLIFFVLQALLYIWSLAKLAEIRRQPVEPRTKLKLLENEDHLFDAGLYLGFAGTVVSLIFVSMGIISQSIMAAYSSTSFGIIFVSVLKIFHIRPLRRQLILQSELQS